MARPRDSQRSKLYRSEPHGPAEFKTVEQCQAFVDEVLASRWVRARWQRRVEVRPGKGHVRATAAPWSGVIQLPLWSRNRHIILHEVAHVLTPDEYACHGPEYAGVLLSLVHHVLGQEAATKLREAFRRNKVRYNLKAVPSSPRYTVPTKAVVAAKRRERDTRPLSADEIANAVRLIRRAAQAGQLGPADRKPRQHALATARLLEGASK